MARFVELSLDGVDVVFSDNYLDAPAGLDSKLCQPEVWGGRVFDMQLLSPTGTKQREARLIDRKECSQREPMHGA